MHVLVELVKLPFVSVSVSVNDWKNQVETMHTT